MVVVVDILNYINNIKSRSSSRHINKIISNSSCSNSGSTSSSCSTFSSSSSSVVV